MCIKGRFSRISYIQVFMLMHLLMFVTKVRGWQTHVGHWKRWRQIGGEGRWEKSPHSPSCDHSGGAKGDAISLLSARWHQHQGTDLVPKYDPWNPDGGAESVMRLLLPCSEIPLTSLYRGEKLLLAPVGCKCLFWYVHAFRYLLEKLACSAVDVFFFPCLNEEREEFCWIRGTDCFVFHVALSKFFILAWESATDMAQTCHICIKARLHVYMIFPETGDWVELSCQVDA